MTPGLTARSGVPLLGLDAFLPTWPGAWRLTGADGIGWRRSLPSGAGVFRTREAGRQHGWVVSFPSPGVNPKAHPRGGEKLALCPSRPLLRPTDPPWGRRQSGLTASSIGFALGGAGTGSPSSANVSDSLGTRRLRTLGRNTPWLERGLS